MLKECRKLKDEKTLVQPQPIDLFVRFVNKKNLDGRVVFSCTRRRWHWQPFYANLRLDSS